MMLRMLDLPEPLLPISSTFFFLGFLTSLRMSPAPALVSPRFRLSDTSAMALC